MSNLAVDRVINVTHSRADSFATAKGFSTPLFITSDATGPLNAAVLTKVYSSLDEVAVDYPAGTEPHNMASAAFSQTIAPVQIKIGYRPAASTTTAAIQTDLQAIFDYDNDWYFFGFDATMRGQTALEDGVIAWVQTQNKIAGFDVNDPNAEVLANVTNIGARNKDKGYDRSFGIYSATPSEYAAIAYMARLSTFNFDDVDSSYTGKFKSLVGISALKKGSAITQIVTGFVPQLGLDTSQGHLLNAYVNVAGLGMVVEGNNFDGSFIDEVHTGDWIVARTEERELSIFANNKKIPYTNAGVQMLVSGIQDVMDRARVAGLIADFVDDDGNFSPAYTITPERVENVPVAQRRQRIFPPIAVKYRYSNAIHYTGVDFVMHF